MNKKLHQIMFPSLKGKWGGIDLDECVGTYHVDWLFAKRNPLLDADKQTEFVNEMHKEMERDYSYGGYLEDRSNLWRGHYHDPDSMFHLGMDFNVPAGTEVALPHGGDVVYIGEEKDQNGGWGGRIDFKSRTLPVYFIIGHLDPASIWQFHPSKQPRSWAGWYPQQHVIGLVGDSSVNGGWYPHVHLQVVANEVYESYKAKGKPSGSMPPAYAHLDPSKIDGYGSVKDDLRKMFPDPRLFLD